MKYESIGRAEGSQKVAQIVLYYKIADELKEVYKEALRSMMESDYEPQDIIMVFNGIEETYELVRSWVEEIGIPSGKSVHYVVLDRNLGFARAMNIGFEIAKKVSNPEYILVVNDDLKMKKYAVKALLRPFKTDSRTGATTGIITRWGEHGIYSTQHVLFTVLTNYRNVFSMGNYATLYCGVPSIAVAFTKPSFSTVLPGAFFMIKREVIERCGFFWNGFVFYCDDFELGVRVWRCGYKVYYLPIVVAEHWAGGTTKAIDKKVLETRLMYSKYYTVAFLGALHKGLHKVNPIVAHTVVDMKNVLSWAVMKFLGRLLGSSFKEKKPQTYLQYLISSWLEGFQKKIPISDMGVSEPRLCLGNPLIETLKLRDGVIDMGLFKGFKDFLKGRTVPKVCEG